VGEVRIIRPNKGPQEAYLATPADIAIFGGSAGSGKSYATILDPLRHVHRPGFAAIAFRREATRLVGGGSLWAESQGIYPATGARAKASPQLEWTWPAGASLEMRHLQYEKDVHAHQGKQYAAIYFDEITEFTEGQFWYLLSRLRTTCGIRPYVRATCNPDPDSFVRRLIDWWLDDEGLPILERSGVLRWFVRETDDLRWFDTRDEARAAYPDREPLSLTFIPASLADNPKGDPTYRDKLLALPLVDRERLLGGNWNIRPAAGLMFKRAWFRDVVDTAPPCVAWMRAWDLAATEARPGTDPDWTRGPKVGLTSDGKLVIADMASLRGTPGEVEALVRATAEMDGPGVTVGLFQDPGQAGKAQGEHYVAQVLRGYPVDVEVASSNKQTYAKIWSPLAERGEVILVRGEWNAAFLAEAEAFPDGKHDDQVDAVSRAALYLLRLHESVGFLHAMTGRGGLRGAVGQGR
jgi:predicted phage terminase large subunit-like protein